MAKIKCWANGGPGELKCDGVSEYRKRGHVAYFHALSGTGSGSCRFSLLPRDLRLLAELCNQVADVCEALNAAGPRPERSHEPTQT